MSRRGRGEGGCRLPLFRPATTDLAQKKDTCPRAPGLHGKNQEAARFAHLRSITPEKGNTVTPMNIKFYGDNFFIKKNTTCEGCPKGSSQDPGGAYGTACLGTRAVGPTRRPAAPFCPIFSPERSS